MEPDTKKHESLKQTIADALRKTGHVAEHAVDEAAGAVAAAVVATQFGSY